MSANFERLVLGCIEADFASGYISTHLTGLFEINIFTFFHIPLHRSKLKICKMLSNCLAVFVFNFSVNQSFFFADFDDFPQIFKIFSITSLTCQIL